MILYINILKLYNFIIKESLKRNIITLNPEYCYKYLCFTFNTYRFDVIKNKFEKNYFNRS